MSKEITRYCSVDLAKAISIVGVIYIHSNVSQHLSLLSAYFRFAVPVFIMISFFLVERALIDRKAELDSRLFWRKRLNRLVIPFVFWSILYFLLHFRERYSSWLQVITLHWAGFGWAGQYYFLVLIQLVLVYPWLRSVTIQSRYRPALLLSGILCFSLFVFFNALTEIQPLLAKLRLVPLFYWLFYVIFAIAAAHKYWIIQKLSTQFSLIHRLILLLSLPLTLVLESYLIPNPEGNLRASSLMVSPLIFLCFLSLEQPLSQNQTPAANLLNGAARCLSTWTLGIFCLNPLIIYLLNHIPFFLITHETWWSSFFILNLKVLLTLSGTLLVSWLIDRFDGGILVR